MRRLLNRAEAPPQDGDGWPFRYVHESGHISAASDFNTWATRIKEHREANGLPPISMAEAEHQLCGTLPPDRCQYEVGDSAPVNINFSFGDVSAWIRAIVAKVVSGEDFVPQEEAERRAAICVTCPLNTQVSSGCGGGCAKLAELLTPGMRKRRTKWDDKLKSCAVCKCYNRIQVHFPLSLVSEGYSYPAWCWKKE